MAIQLSITNVFRFISYITPVLLIFFMIMISVFNQDVKGLIYLGGVLITIFITVACKNMIRHPSNNPHIHVNCLISRVMHQTIRFHH